MSDAENKLHLRIRNAYAEITRGAAEVSRWLKTRNAPASAEYLAVLAIEEQATNCIKYGYDDAAEHVIEIELSLSGEEMVLTVTDDGHPFNPLNAPPPDTGSPIEDRPVGGLGIHLLRGLSDRIQYERLGDRNRLAIHKAIAGPP